MPLILPRVTASAAYTGAHANQPSIRSSPAMAATATSLDQVISGESRTGWHRSRSALHGLNLFDSLHCPTALEGTATHCSQACLAWARWARTAPGSAASSGVTAAPSTSTAVSPSTMLTTRTAKPVRTSPGCPNRAQSDLMFPGSTDYCNTGTFQCGTRASLGQSCAFDPIRGCQAGLFPNIDAVAQTCVCLSTPQPGPSGRARVRARERRELTSLCPASHTACSVGSAGGYECIDTSVSFRRRSENTFSR